MPRVVDLELLRQMTNDSMRAYEAVQQAYALTIEGKAVLEQVEALLHQTTLAFVSEDVTITNAKRELSRAARTALVTEYVDIRKAYANLQDGLYRLAQAQLGDKAWNDALITLDALGKLEANYRDAATIRAKIPALEAADRQDAEKRKREAVLLQPIRAMEFVRVPAGEFLMGDNQQRVQVAEFWMAKYPVTVAQFDAFVQLTGYREASAEDVKVKANHPVVNVNLSDAAAFCDWASTVLNKTIRLPTEQEWEKAARGTDGRMYPWGNEPPDGTRCNFNNSGGGTSPVNKYSPRGDSPYGCADMAGNVWEWTSSAHEQAGNAVRGGSWGNAVSGITAVYRSWDPPWLWGLPLIVGFRCAF